MTAFCYCTPLLEIKLIHNFAVHCTLLNFCKHYSHSKQCLHNLQIIYSIIFIFEKSQAKKKGQSTNASFFAKNHGGSAWADNFELRLDNANSEGNVENVVYQQNYTLMVNNVQSMVTLLSDNLDL